MTEKITSAEAYEHFKSIPFQPLGGGYFDRIDVERHLKVVGEVNDFIPPSGKSFLDWARREELVETVSRGVYRWAPTAESEAADIGRQMAQETITDMDPANPMHEDEEHDHYMDPCPQPAFDPINEAHILLGAKRIPRKSKKRMKSAILKGGGVRKVTVHYNTTDTRWM